MVNPDGSSLVCLGEEVGDILQAAASPFGAIVAFITTGKSEAFSDLRSKYLTLPDGEVRQKAAIVDRYDPLRRELQKLSSSSPALPKPPDQHKPTHVLEPQP